MPLTDYAEIWDSVSNSCRSVRSMDLMIVFRGNTGETRFRRTRTRTAFERPGALRLEGLAPFGAPAFIFVAQLGEAVLLLPRDRKVVRNASAANLLHALAGLALDPEDVGALLTGCVVPDGVAVAARAYGEQWVAIDLEGGASVYVKEIDNERLITIGTSGDLTVEYSEHIRGLPRHAQIQLGTGSSRTDLSVDLSQVTINTDFDSVVFAATVPEGFESITLDDLRRRSPTKEHAEDTQTSG